MLALHPSRPVFAGSTFGDFGLIWSSETFEVLLRINLPKDVLAFDLRDREVLFVGVRDFGVLACDLTTGKMNSDRVPAVSYVVDIAGLINSCDVTFVFV